MWRSPREIIGQSSQMAAKPLRCSPRILMRRISFESSERTKERGTKRSSSSSSRSLPHVPAFTFLQGQNTIFEQVHERPNSLTRFLSRAQRKRRERQASASLPSSPPNLDPLPRCGCPRRSPFSTSSSASLPSASSSTPSVSILLVTRGCKRDSALRPLHLRFSPSSAPVELPLL